MKKVKIYMSFNTRSVENISNDEYDSRQNPEMSSPDLLQTPESDVLLVSDNTSSVPEQNYQIVTNVKQSQPKTNSGKQIKPQGLTISTGLDSRMS